MCKLINEDTLIIGETIYTAIAAMLYHGGPEVQMIGKATSHFGEWQKADGVSSHCLYRMKPILKPTFEMGYREPGTTTSYFKELIAPETKTPKMDYTYWTLLGDGISWAVWHDYEIDRARLARGCVFLTQADAQAYSDWSTTCRTSNKHGI